jgi:hypothetical protein
LDLAVRPRVVVGVLLRDEQVKAAVRIFFTEVMKMLEQM